MGLPVPFGCSRAERCCTGQLWYLSNAELCSRIRTQLNTLIFDKTLRRKDVSGSSASAPASDAASAVDVPGAAASAHPSASSAHLANGSTNLKAAKERAIPERETAEDDGSKPEIPTFSSRGQILNLFCASASAALAGLEPNVAQLSMSIALATFPTSPSRSKTVHSRSPSVPFSCALSFSSYHGPHAELCQVPTARQCGADRNSCQHVRFDVVFVVLRLTTHTASSFRLITGRARPLRLRRIASCRLEIVEVRSANPSETVVC